MLGGLQWFKEFMPRVTEAVVPRPPTHPNPFGTYSALTVETVGAFYFEAARMGRLFLVFKQQEIHRRGGSRLACLRAPSGAVLVRDRGSVVV